MSLKDTKLRNARGNMAADLFSLVPPKTWKVQVPTRKGDAFDYDTGGLFIADAIKQTTAKEKLLGAVESAVDKLNM